MFPGFNDSNYLIPRPLHESYSVPPPARPVLSPLTPPTPSSPFYTNLPSYQIPPSPVKVSASADFPYQNSLTFSLPSYMDNYKIPAGGLARAFSPSASPTEKEPPHHLTPFGAYLEMQASREYKYYLFPCYLTQFLGEPFICYLCWMFILIFDWLDRIFIISNILSYDNRLINTQL